VTRLLWPTLNWLIVHRSKITLTRIDSRSTRVIKKAGLMSGFFVAVVL
jgi:hypothetical protein